LGIKLVVGLSREQRGAEGGLVTSTRHAAFVTRKSDEGGSSIKIPKFKNG